MRFNVAYKQRVEEYSEDGRRAEMEIAKEVLSTEEVMLMAKGDSEWAEIEDVAKLAREALGLRARTEQQARIIDAYNVGGFFDADAMAIAYCDVRDELAQLRIQLATAQEECDLQAGIIAADTAHVESLQAELAALRETNARLSAGRAEPGKCLDCGASLREPTHIGYCETCFCVWLKEIDAAKLTPTPATGAPGGTKC
jgi:hypothetical protein